MNTWIIEPRDPLIARDGRPFSADPGALATSLPFPFPSTTTGGLRTRAGENGNGVFVADPDHVRQIAVHGPFLVELKKDDSIAQWLVPAPLDCLLLKIEGDADNVRRKRLVPVEPPDEALAPLPDGVAYPVGVQEPESEDQKPASGPSFWHWKTFAQWLQEPPAEVTIALEELGHDGPTPESRMHVALNDETFTHIDGGLFGTRGLEFTRARKDRAPLRLALALRSDCNDDVNEGAGRLGGERRLMRWQKSVDGPPDCPCRKQIIADGACRMILLTPAYFEDGWRPAWIDKEAKGVTIHLQAACIGRPATVSGWDFVLKKPKPTRRLVPAGSVFFLNLEGTDEAIGEWVDRTWMSPVSDEENAARDGFGLAALGVWDGAPRKEEL